MSGQLVLGEGGLAGRYLLGERTTIGRDPQCTIAVPDPLVSRQHVEIQRLADQSYRLVHLGTSHGTYVNAQEVKQAALKHGDEIVIGATVLRFEQVEWSEVALDKVVIDGETNTPALRARRPVGDWEYRRLHPAYGLLRELSLATDVESLLTRMLAAGFELFEPDRMVILLTTPPHAQLVPRRARVLPALADKPIRISRTVVNQAVASQQAVLSVDASADPRFERANSVSTEGIRSVMCCPMIVGQELLGLVYLDSTSASGLFEESDVELLALFGSHTGLSIRNATLRDNAHRALLAEKQRLDMLVNRLPEAIFVLDGACRIVLTNERAQQLVRAWGEPMNGVLDRIGAVPTSRLVQTATDRPVEVKVSRPANAVYLVRAVLLDPSAAAPQQTILILQEATPRT